MKALFSTVVHVVCSLLVWRFVMIFVFHFRLCFFLFLFCFFCLSFFSPRPLSLVVCENREEPWSWFQYLWWHQRPGEPLQTLRHGTTRNPAFQPITASPALPQSCHGNCCSLPQSFVSLSVCLSVSRAAVDVVNFECVISYYRLLEKTAACDLKGWRSLRCDKALNLLKHLKSLLASPNMMDDRRETIPEFGKAHH